MARYEKRTADYFPFMVKEGRTLMLLEAKYRAVGTGFFTNVLRILCSTPDHYVSIKDEPFRSSFFAQAKVDMEQGLDMLEIMVLTGKIDETLYEEAGIIYSQDLVDSITDAYTRRTNPVITIQDVYRIAGLSLDGINVSRKINASRNDHKRYINAGSKCISASRNDHNSYINTQTKLEQTKVKGTRTEEEDPFLDIDPMYKPYDTIILDMYKRTLTDPERILLKEMIARNGDQTVLDELKKITRKTNRPQSPIHYMYKYLSGDNRQTVPAAPLSVDDIEEVDW